MAVSNALILRRGFDHLGQMLTATHIATLHEGIARFAACDWRARGVWMDAARAAAQVAGDSRSGDHLRAAATSVGISPERVLVATPLPLDAHLARCVQADLYLDTWHCGGHLSLRQALSVDVPVPTLAGAGKAMLSDAGLPDLVAISASNHLARAIALCASRDARHALRSRVSDAFAGRPASSVSTATCAARKNTARGRGRTPSQRDSARRTRANGT